MKASRIILSTVSAASLCWSAEVGAQAGSASQAPQKVATAGETGADALQEIVVTAERREQSVQKSALTIDVVSADEVLSSGLSSAADLGKLTTGVEIGSGGSNAQIYIRGVGSFAFGPLAVPGVAFNVDGVYVGRPDSVNGNFYDISRVEVLKGPQGTLYGRNANGGSINVITNVPQLVETSAAFDVEGGNYSLKHITGAVNLPIGNSAALRGAFNVVHRDGYLSDGTNDDVEQAGRLRFLWEPAAELKLLLNADYEHLGGKGAGTVFLPQRPDSSPWEAVSAPAAQVYQHTYPALVPFAPFTNFARGDSYQHNNYYNLSAQLDWNLGFATLTVLPAYRRSDVNYLTYISARYEALNKTDQSSLEVRLGNSASRLTWVLGAYYYDESQNGQLFIDAGDVPVPFLGGAVLQDYHNFYTPTTRAYAAFGQATLEVAQGLRLIAGGRETYEDSKTGGAIYDASQTPPVLFESFPGHASFDGFTYKVGAEYDLAPQNMVYATYGTGFKAGGFSQTIAPGNVYQPEHLRALEIGSKNRFLNSHLQVNASFYHWKYTDIQDSRVTFNSEGKLNFITFNSGDATIYGGTFELVAKPTETDTLSVSTEYAHSRYDRFVINTPTAIFQPGSNGCALSSANGNTVQDCTGFQVARVPKWTGTASYDHMFPLPHDAALTFGASVKYTSARWIGIDFIPAERDGSYTVVDANLTYSSPQDRWRIGFFGRNLTNRVYYQGGIEQAFIAGLFGANVAPPRTYGVHGSVRF